MWRRLGQTNLEHQSPQFAGMVQTASVLVLVALFAIAGSDPYTEVFSWSGTFGALGILLLQFMVSVAVIAFFWRDSRGFNLWRRLLAPALSALGLAVSFALMASHLDLVSGSNSLLVQRFPGLLLAIGLSGFAFAALLKARKPQLYAAIGREPG